MQGPFGQFGSAKTGTIAATTNGTLWTFRYPDYAANQWDKWMRVRRIHVQVTTKTAFDVPVTAGRGLNLVRAAADAIGTANPSGGAAWSPGHKRPGSTETLGVGRVATTAALTTTGYTFESEVAASMGLMHCGAANANYDEVWRFDDVEAESLYIAPGGLIGLQTDGALDAGGTIQVRVKIDAVGVYR